MCSCGSNCQLSLCPPLPYYTIDLGLFYVLGFLKDVKEGNNLSAVLHDVRQLSQTADKRIKKHAPTVLPQQSSVIAAVDLHLAKPTEKTAQVDDRTLVKSC